MNSSRAAAYIDDELSQLGTSYVDLLLFHHRCSHEAETADVWKAFEQAKAAGKARHIGVSNFNTHDLATLVSTAKEPIEVLEAHFGVGVMDFEVIKFANEHNIHPIGYSELSEWSTDHPTIHPAVTAVAAAHNISWAQVLFSYVYSYNITVLSSYDPIHPSYVEEDLAIFRIKLSAAERRALDNVTAGKRTCPDCYTDECQACAATLKRLGCPLGMELPVWGRSNKNGTQCLTCAAASAHKDVVFTACGTTGRGESLETLLPKACGI